MPIQNVSVSVGGVVKLICYLALSNDATTLYWEYSQSPAPSSSYTRLLARWPNDPTPPVKSGEHKDELEETDVFNLTLTGVSEALTGYYRCGFSMPNQPDQKDDQITHLTVTEPLPSTTVLNSKQTADAAPEQPDKSHHPDWAWAVIAVIVIVIVIVVTIAILAWWKKKLCLNDNDASSNQQDTMQNRPDPTETDNLVQDERAGPTPDQDPDQKGETKDPNRTKLDKQIDKDTSVFKQMLAEKLKNAVGDETVRDVKRRALQYCRQVFEFLDLEDGNKSSSAEGIGEEENRGGVTPFVEYAGELFCQIRQISDRKAGCLHTSISTMDESDTDAISSSSEESITEKGTWVHCASFMSVIKDELPRMDDGRDTYKEILKYIKSECKRQKQNELSEPARPTPKQQNATSSSGKTFDRADSVDVDSIELAFRLSLSKHNEGEKELVQLYSLIEIVYAKTSYESQKEGGVTHATAENPEADGKPSIAGLSLTSTGKEIWTTSSED